MAAARGGAGHGGLRELPGGVQDHYGWVHWGRAALVGLVNQQHQFVA